MELGYCTNVHAGADLQATRTQLETHAVAVRESFSGTDPMGIGLWLSASTAEGLLQGGELEPFANWLAEVGLVPFTLNGFPYGDFHQDVVKHDVYLPDWADPRRETYTQRLIEILDRLLPEGKAGSISTLPLMWGKPDPGESTRRQCAQALLRIASYLQQLEENTGRLIFICIEPEPGCLLQTTQDIVTFYEQYLFEGAPDPVDVTRYLRVCHDVCHAAVMFEDQADVLQRFQRLGIQVGKVQVSSAIAVNWDEMDDVVKGEAMTELSQFAEDRYLHQTVVNRGARKALKFFEDLPQAIEKVTSQNELPTGQWRIHFHVPIYLESFGKLKTSQADIRSCMEAVKSFSSVSHFEVETYAWNVLPKSLQHEKLADGIAAELTWFRNEFGI